MKDSIRRAAQFRDVSVGTRGVQEDNGPLGRIPQCTGKILQKVVILVKQRGIVLQKEEGMMCLLQDAQELECGERTPDLDLRVPAVKAGEDPGIVPADVEREEVSHAVQAAIQRRHHHLLRGNEQAPGPRLEENIWVQLELHARERCTHPLITVKGAGGESVPGGCEKRDEETVIIRSLQVLKNEPPCRRSRKKEVRRYP
jgi:hypothetical protein